MPTLHIRQEIRKGKPNEPIAIKTILGWVLMGGKLENYHNCVASNKLNLQNLDTLLESEERFWELAHSRKDDGQSLFRWFIVERTQTSSAF